MTEYHMYSSLKGVVKLKIFKPNSYINKLSKFSILNSKIETYWSIRISQSLSSANRNILGNNFCMEVYQMNENTLIKLSWRNMNSPFAVCLLRTL